MRKKKIRELMELMAFLLIVAGLVIIVQLTGAAMNGLINKFQFFGGLGIASTTLVVVIRWVNIIEERRKNG